MKANSLTLLAWLFACALCVAPARAQQQPPPTPPTPPDTPSRVQEEQRVKKIQKTKVKIGTAAELEERSIAVAPDVTINLCMEAGKVTVRGGDRNEIRARLPKGMRLEFRRAVDADSATPAKRLELLLSEPPDEDEPHFSQCSGAGEVELEVPRDATLFFKSEQGEFDVDRVAEAHIETHSGRILLRHITRAAEAASIDGDVSLEDSSGRVRLKSFVGSVEATNVSKIAEGDFFKADSISNDVMLENVSHSRVEVSTISGEITMSGPLARAGHYDLRTTSGDITLTMPIDSSFKLAAKVSAGGEIVTDFPLKYTGGISSPGLLSAGRMIGTYGTGDAQLNLISFSGTLRLRRQ